MAFAQPGMGQWASLSMGHGAVGGRWPGGESLRQVSYNAVASACEKSWQWRRALLLQGPAPDVIACNVSRVCTWKPSTAPWLKATDSEVHQRMREAWQFCVLSQLEWQGDKMVILCNIAIHCWHLRKGLAWELALFLLFSSRCQMFPHVSTVFTRGK